MSALRAFVLVFALAIIAPAVDAGRRGAGEVSTSGTIAVRSGGRGNRAGNDEYEFMRQDRENLSAEGEVAELGDANQIALGSLTTTTPTARTCNLAYCNAYPGLKNAFCGGSTCTTNAQATKCLNHWNGSGQNEGRSPNPVACAAATPTPTTPAPTTPTPTTPQPTENLASNTAVTVTASSLGGWGTQQDAKVVTDGERFKIVTDLGYIHSDYEINPWVEIDLGSSKSVAVTRTIMRHDSSFPAVTLRSAGFTVEVDSTICGENQPVISAHGLNALTTDTVCGSTLTGQKVKVSLPTGGRRFLCVTEVEVYGPGIGGPGLAASFTCYNDTGSHVYPDMNTCNTCIGPGPSQCTSCEDGKAFVMWNNETQAGSCHTIKTDTIVISSPGTATPGLAAQTQVHTKFWAKKLATLLTRPDVVTVNGNPVYNETIGVYARCEGVKQLVCGAAAPGSNTSICTQQKNVWLVEVETDSPSYGGNTLKHVPGEDNWIPAAEFIGYYNDSAINTGNAVFLNPCMPFTMLF